MDLQVCVELVKNVKISFWALFTLTVNLMYSASAASRPFTETDWLSEKWVKQMHLLLINYFFPETFKVDPVVSFCIARQIGVSSDKAIL